ncbi:hypothetical protein R0K17_09380 [Planococcus sp. SIMBA_143]
MDKKAVPVMADLVSEGYLKTGETSCPNGEVINISVDGVVSSSKAS